MSCKPVIAVDLDEVIGTFLQSITEYYNATYSKNVEVKDYKRLADMLIAA